MIIENFNFDSNNKTFVVAEISANHNQDFNTALKTIDAIKYAGADAVKIQTFTADEMTINSDLPEFKARKGTIWEGQKLYDLYQECETPRSWHSKLKEHAEGLNLIFFSTPFQIEAVDFLEDLEVPVYKIASPEITDIPLIEYIAAKGKPVIFSTGIAQKDDINRALDAIRKTGNNEIAVLKCTTSYPAPYSEINLKTIPDIKKNFNVVPGLSDHTLGHEVAIAAVALGARIVEKHFILDRNLGGPDAKFSAEPNEFKNMVDAIRNVEMSLGVVNYDLTKTTEKSKNAARSLYVIKDIKKGEKFTKNNIRSLRPKFGIHPKYYKNIIGKSAAININCNSPLLENMIESWDN